MQPSGAGPLPPELPLEVLEEDALLADDAPLELDEVALPEVEPLEELVDPLPDDELAALLELDAPLLDVAPLEELAALEELAPLAEVLELVDVDEPVVDPLLVVELLLPAPPDPSLEVPAVHPVIAARSNVSAAGVGGSFFMMVPRRMDERARAAQRPRSGQGARARAVGVSTPEGAHRAAFASILAREGSSTPRLRGRQRKLLHRNIVA
jgi:hypothetical protein